MNSHPYTGANPAITHFGSRILRRETAPNGSNKPQPDARAGSPNASRSSGCGKVDLARLACRYYLILAPTDCQWDLAESENIRLRKVEQNAPYYFPLDSGGD